jgi:hypothetical protein
MLAGINYPCTASNVVGASPEWVYGGQLVKYTVDVCILQNDLPNPPINDTLALFRGLQYRVLSVNDAATTMWQITLVQVDA